MKRLLFYVAMFLLALLVGYIVKEMRPDQVNKLLSIDTEYAFLMEDGQMGTLLYYINDDNHELTHPESYARIVIKDRLNSSLIELTLYDVKLGHEENYLGEHFKRIILTFIVPIFSEDWIFEDAYLCVDTVMQNSYDIRLGRLSFYQKSWDEPKMNWTSLDGRKEVGELKSRLGEIELVFDHEIPEISNIDVGTKASVSHIVQQNKLTITISNNDYLLYEVPIIITFIDGTKQTLSHFRYMIDYFMLKESGPLINVYTLD